MIAYIRHLITRIESLIPVSRRRHDAQVSDLTRRLQMNRAEIARLTSEQSFKVDRYLWSLIHARANAAISRADCTKPDCTEISLRIDHVLSRELINSSGEDREEMMLMVGQHIARRLGMYLR